MNPLFQPIPQVGIPQTQFDLPVPNAPVQRGGMFGGGKPDWGSAIAAALNGYLAAGGNPAGQMGLQALHQKKMMEQRQAQEAAQYEMQRQHGREDKQWEWQNAPKAPYRWEANDGSLMELGPDGQPRVAYKDPTPKPNYIQVRDPQTGELRIVNMGAVGGQPAQEEVLDVLPEGAVPIGGAGQSQAPRGFPY